MSKINSLTTKLEESPAPKPHNRLFHSFFTGLSIKQRLPLLIVVLLGGVIVASTWAAHEGVKDSARKVGRERLLNLTQQLANLQQQSNVTLLGKTFAGANDPAVRTFLKTPSGNARLAALAALKPFTPRDPSVLQVELWDANRSLVLTIPEGSSP